MNILFRSDGLVNLYWCLFRSNSRSRPPTPTHDARSSGRRRASSPWPLKEQFPPQFDVEELQTDIRNLMARISGAERERYHILSNKLDFYKVTCSQVHHIFVSLRDEALHQVATLKRQNDDLLLNTVQLEDQVSKQRKKVLVNEEQLRKLEHKGDARDSKLNEQVRNWQCNFGV